MKKSLLEIVQDILNDLDSDAVNSIDDTVEAQQVANIVKQCFEEMQANRKWRYTRSLIQLDHVGDLNKPNYLKLPERVSELSSFNYDKRKVGQTKPVLQEVKYKEPDEFLRYVSNRNADNDNVVEVTDFGGTTLLIFNNAAPVYWTSFDDTHLITDSYDVEVDDTLRKSKTQCIAYLSPLWEHRDDAIPDLPEEAFPALVEEAKSTAFYVIKQMANQKAEQKASRQNRWLARKQWRAAGGIQYPDYGRKGRR
jgi:hypothetical protein